MATNDELYMTLARSILTAMATQPADVQERTIIRALKTVEEGVQAGVTRAVDEQIRATLGPLYAGPGKLRDRVRALEALERVAREVLVDSYDPILARGALLAALVDIDATEASKTG